MECDKGGIHENEIKSLKIFQQLLWGYIEMHEKKFEQWIWKSYQEKYASNCDIINHYKLKINKKKDWKHNS